MIAYYIYMICYHYYCNMKNYEGVKKMVLDNKNIVLRDALEENLSQVLFAEQRQ